jgi:hypothetical protein
MADYHSILVRAVSHLPSTADEARRAIYEQARTALHKRLGNDPQISDAELVNVTGLKWPSTKWKRTCYSEKCVGL